ncbi:unnamed protein product [Closterium sp. NIES-64]|nr:unnamed protein product [Closterium sp. NIES-64]
MSTGDVTKSLFHVSSNSPDVWWSLPDGISERLPLPPGRWQKIEELSHRMGVHLSPDLLLRCLTQDMYYYLLMPGAQCTLNHQQQDGREDGSREDGSREDEGKRSSASGPSKSDDEPITYFTAHSRVSNRSLAGIGGGALGLPAAMLSFSDALLMQGKRAMLKGGDTVESSLVACTMEALVGAVYAEKGLEAASAFVTRLLPSLVDSRATLPHAQKLEFGHQYWQQLGHEHGHQQQQRIQPGGEGSVTVGEAAAEQSSRVQSAAERSDPRVPVDPVARLQQMSLQQLGLIPQYRHTGTDNPGTAHMTERVRVYAAGRRMGTGMGATVEEAKRDGAAKALLAWGKVWFGEGGSEDAEEGMN